MAAASRRPTSRRLQQLMSLFSYLAVQTSGDVQEALEWLKQLAEEYGLFDENMTMDDLIDKLREMGIIEDAEIGLPAHPARAIQRIRQDALREIFTSLKKAPTGAHETPYTGKGRRPAERNPEIQLRRPADEHRPDLDADERLPARRHRRFHAEGRRPRGLRDRTPDDLRHGAHDRHQPQHDPLRRGPDYPRQAGRRWRSPS